MVRHEGRRKGCRSMDRPWRETPARSHFLAAPRVDSRSFAGFAFHFVPSLLGVVDPDATRRAAREVPTTLGIRIQRIAARIERIGRMGERDRDTGPNCFGGVGLAAMRSGR